MVKSIMNFILMASSRMAGVLSSVPFQLFLFRKLTGPSLAEWWGAGYRQGGFYLHSSV